MIAGVFWPSKLVATRHQLSAVGNDHRRWHRHRKGGLVGARGGGGPAGRLLALGSGGPHPRQIRRDRSHHRHRRRPCPGFVGQARDHRLVAGRCRVEFGGQRFPSCRGAQQGRRPGTDVHPAGVHLWRQCSEIHRVSYLCVSLLAPLHRPRIGDLGGRGSPMWSTARRKPRGVAFRSADRGPTSAAK